MKLQASNIYKSYGAQDVLSGANLTVKGNEKVALVGRNGCGKTTLMKIICRIEEPDQGSVVMASGTRLGYLSQITFEDEQRTVYEELLTVFEELTTLQARLESQALVLEKDHSDQQLEKYEKLQTRFEALGGYDYEYELKNVFFSSKRLICTKSWKSFPADSAQGSVWSSCFLPNLTSCFLTSRPIISISNRSNGLKDI